jgi:hypothetical protein
MPFLNEHGYDKIDMKWSLCYARICIGIPNDVLWEPINPVGNRGFEAGVVVWERGLGGPLPICLM